MAIENAITDNNSRPTTLMRSSTIPADTVQPRANPSTGAQLVEVGALVPGSGATSLGKAEDAVAASGDIGIFQLGVRRDAPVISASANGDYNEMAVTQHGALYTQTVDGMKRTYSAAARLTTVVSGQVPEIFGAASTTVEINRITLTLFGTAAGVMDFTVNKRSAVATGGTATNPTKVPYNAADAAAASTLKVYTVVPTTPGTLVGALRQGMLYTGAGVPSDRIKIESGSYSKSFTLTSATQSITVDLAGTVPTGAVLAVDIEWTEF